jgi:hypothetical protein
MCARHSAQAAPASITATIPTARLRGPYRISARGRATGARVDTLTWHGVLMIPVFSGTVISLEKDGGHAARG